MKQYKVNFWDWRNCLIAEAVFSKKSDAVNFGAKQLTKGRCYACDLTYQGDIITKRLGNITEDGRVV